MSLFPHTREIKIGDFRLQAQEVIALVGPLMTAERREKIDQVLRGRTYGVVPVLENIYDRGNASAVMRSSEGMGFQSVHMIELGERFKEANRVTQGADKWLDVVRWKNTTECISHLKTRGYQILATHLEGSVPIGAVDFSKPSVLVYGNEKDGVSQELLDLADQRVVIPMQGFVQSYNISVAAAISLYHVFEERTRRLGRNGDLTQEEQMILRAHYYLKSTRNPQRLIARLLERKK